MIPSYLLRYPSTTGSEPYTQFSNFVFNFTKIYRQKQFIKSAQEIGTHFWKTSFVTSYAEPSRLHVPLKNFCKMKLMIQLDVKIYRFFTTKYLICEFWSLFDFRARHLMLGDTWSLHGSTIFEISRYTRKSKWSVAAISNECCR